MTLKIEEQLPQILRKGNKELLFGLEKKNGKKNKQISKISKVDESEPSV